MTSTFSQEMGTDPIDDAEWWRQRYSDAEPVGYSLRAAFSERWVRIHSLQRSKRYPEDSSDWATLIDRHRTVSSKVLGTPSMCYLITPWWCWQDACFSSFELRSMPSLPEFRPEPDEPPSGGYSGKRIQWDFDQFEPVLRAVAEDVVSATVVSEDELRVYAPYDGGADLFLPDSDSRDAVRDSFRDFLSRRTDGL
jgi:hypothetical protein